MVLDFPELNEQQNIDRSSHDQSTANIQAPIIADNNNTHLIDKEITPTPIITDSNAMITDDHDTNTNGDNSSGSSNTQNAQQQNNDEITRKRFRKKFLPNPNKFIINDSNKSALNRIKSIRSATPNNPKQQQHVKQYPNSSGPSSRYNTPYNKDNARPYPSRNNQFKEGPPHQVTSFRIQEKQHQTPLHNEKGKERESYNSDIKELKDQIAHLNAIIKELSSEIGHINIKQKSYTEDITLLKQQERRHSEDIEKIRQECIITNNKIQEQSDLIKDILEMASILRNINNSGIFSQLNHQDTAYGSHNYAYAHPPADLYAEEYQQDQYQQDPYSSDYAESNASIESTATVTRQIFPDDDYTPSQPTTSSFPSITSRGGFMMNNQNLYQISGLENQKTNPFSKIGRLLSSKNPFKKNKKHQIIENQKNISNIIDNDIIHNPVLTNNNESLYPSLILATHNIQGSFNKMRDDILSYMILHNIDCLFVCETNIVDPNFSPSLNTAWQKVIAPFNHNKHIFYVVNNPDLEHRGSGGIFILTKKLHQHLQSTVILEQGRCIKLTLNFKNRKIFNIYGIYLPSTSGNNDHVKIAARFNNVCRILFEDIFKEKSRDHLYETILGDFNINYKKHILNNNKSVSYLEALQKTKNNKLELWMCYKILKILNFDNVASMFNKVLEPTWFPPVNSNKSPTTVDYIWVSTNLKEIISQFQISRSSYSSDHAILMVAFPHPNNDFINHKSFDKSRNQTNNNNNRYNLSNLSPDDWITFNNKVDNYILTTADIISEPVQKDITDFMEQLNKIIFDVLEDMKVKKLKITPKRNNLPLQLRQKYNQIHQLTSLQATLKEVLYFFSEDFTTDIHSTIEQRKGLKNNFDRLWARKSNWVIKLFHQYKINHSLILLNHTLNTSSEVEEITINISNLIMHIETLIHKERKEWDVKQIEYFINRRNEDIKLNQKRALNSILERNSRKIIIDRIKYYEGDELKYSIDPQIINDKVNTHFQNIGSSSKSPLTYNPILEMPEPWCSVYSPKTNIKKDAIEKLLLPISMEELTSTIKSLPNNKAPGPSGIPYEIFKKLPPNFLKTLLKFYNLILDCGILPSSWQEALLYPIPKPTWWDNDIKHT
ncbi:unnamed protein product [Rhizophagus irregularis]|nr:unnamed protein product [Rhizophagus irregularis]